MGTLQTADVSPGQYRGVYWRLRRAGMGLLTSILVVFGVAVTDAMADSPTRVIETTSGPVRGVSDGVVNKFQGIRYANSTAGANRWTPPTAPARAHTEFDANTPVRSCAQLVSSQLVKIACSSTSRRQSIRTATTGSPFGSSCMAARLLTVQARLSTPAFWSALTRSSSSPSIIASERWAGSPIQPWTAMESPATTG